MHITFLGTSCMVPTKERNVSAIYFDYLGEGILIDCGEGTQRQMNIAGIPRNKVKKILISHFHGDHMGGMIGLLQTIGNEKSQQEIKIFGPKGTKKFMEHMLQCCHFDLNVQLDIKEVIPRGVETFFENDLYALQATELDHGVPCLGYAFVEKDKRKINTASLKKYGIPDGPLVGTLKEGTPITYKGENISPEQVSSVVKGKKIAVISDTQFTQHCLLLTEGSDLLICEASYSSRHEEKAEQYKHMTAKQAAYIANSSQVKKLVLTHISQRYKTGEELLEDAKDTFADVVIAYDFMTLTV